MLIFQSDKNDEYVFFTHLILFEMVPYSIFEMIYLRVFIYGKSWQYIGLEDLDIELKYTDFSLGSIAGLLTQNQRFV